MDYIFAVIGKIVVVFLLIYGLSEIRVKINQRRKKKAVIDPRLCLGINDLERQVIVDTIKEHLNECNKRSVKCKNKN